MVHINSTSTLVMQLTKANLQKAQIVNTAEMISQNIYYKKHTLM